MAEVSRSYSKGNPEKELLPKQKSKTVNVVSTEIHFVDAPSSDYQKRDVGISPIAFFVIVSGGQKREKDYFKVLSFRDRFKRIKLEFIADPLKLNPKGMYEIAEYKKAHYSTSQNEDAEPDKIFLISDVDHFIDELLEIKPKCEESSFVLIISNSCFEVWLYYAFHDSIPSFRIPTDPLKISGKFKGWLPSVIPGGIKPLQAVQSIHSNIVNAKKNYKEDEFGIPELFSTNMFLLASELVPLIEPELTIMIDDNKRSAAKFQEK